MALKLQGKPTRKWTKIENSQVWTMDIGEVYKCDTDLVIHTCLFHDGVWSKPCHLQEIAAEFIARRKVWTSVNLNLCLLTILALTIFL